MRMANIILQNVKEKGRSLIMDENATKCEFESVHRVGSPVPRAGISVFRHFEATRERPS